MNRKANPWVSLEAIALLAIILATVCSGCEPVEASAEAPKRFTVTHKENTAGWIVRIFTDTETGVQYLLVGDSSGYGIGCGLTALQPGTAETEEANQ